MTGCRLCGAATAPLLAAHDRNRERSAETFAYVRCVRCATVQIQTIPDDLARFYAGDYHGVPTAAEIRRHAAHEQHKLDLLDGYVQPGRLIEIGPSFGAFALAARERGHAVTAIEMDEECCAILESPAVAVRAIRSAAPQDVLAQLEPARVIALWHVLEHLSDPAAVIAAAAVRLEPGGVLAIATPNPQSLQFRLLRARWAHLDAPRHLQLITHETLVGRARAGGLALLRTVTDDPFARHCNRFGWEYALRRRPARGPSPASLVRASQVLEKVLAPIERRGLSGAAYTVVLRRPGAG